jgi:hypothetical protein
MRIFISWAGDISHQAARSLRDLLPRVLPAADILLWDESSLQAGSAWASILEEELARTELVAPCVTRDNMESPWLNFELGLISSRLGRARVLPLLIDLPASNLRGPLTQFRCFSTSKSELKAFVTSITATVSPEKAASDTLDVSFESWWPAISAGLHVFRDTTAALSGPEVTTARGSMRRVENLDVLTARVSRDTTEEELIRRINTEYGFQLSDEEIKRIVLQAEEMNRVLKALFEVDVTNTMPILKLDKRISS